MISAIARRVIGAEYASLLYRLMAENAWPFRWHYAAALLLMAISSAMFAAVALLMKDVFNDVFIAQDPGALRWLAGVILVIFVVRGAAMFGSNVLLARIGNRIVAGLQARLYDHIVGQGMAFHEDNRSGDMAVRIGQNCNAARLALNTLAIRVGMDLTAVIGFVAVMLWNDVPMTLIALLGAPVVFGGIATLVRRIKKLAAAEITLTGQILTIMSETITGARVVKAFNLERHMKDRADEAIDGVRDRADRIAITSGMAAPLMEVVAGAGAAAVLFYAGWRIIDGGMEVGTFVSFLIALIALGDPARRLAQVIVQLRQHTTAIEFIYATLDTDRRVAQAADAPALHMSGGEVYFDDVHFTYGEVPALAGLSFTAQAGKVTALVGPSGAGKSTVLSILERFYDPTAGKVTIDGQDIAAVRLSSLRDHMALVTQETFLFDTTVAENIRLGRSDATDEDIEAAARQANAHEFILALEHGYETMVGEGGLNLSGGQRQRVAIARAMLRNAPVLLLDEATSALDAESEARVQEALERLMEGRTTIVIAHRLATIRRANQIAVLDKGRLVEQGTHDYLVEQDGLYARLAALQFGSSGGANT
ncbi:MAG: ABC transporter ATP-binding protein [Paracoccaceae bacterium]